jgi:uncharacterized protein (TIGR03435 family)
MVRVGVLFLIATSFSHAQSFEVASVKPVPSDTEWSYRFPSGGRTVLTGCRLRDLILLAWRIQGFRVLGTTGWMDSERFNVEAKAEGNPGPEESRRMLQSLLADRFRLTFHRETRDLQTYSLVPAKAGARMTPSRPGICTPYDDSSSLSPAGADLPVCGFRNYLRKPENGPPAMVIEALGLDMSRFARVLAALLAGPVNDATGIAGAWDFHLEFAPDDRLVPGVDNSGPSLVTAIQEQLGLKLETRRGPVEVFVVEHAERPSAN